MSLKLMTGDNMFLFLHHVLLTVFIKICDKLSHAVAAASAASIV